MGERAVPVGVERAMSVSQNPSSSSANRAAWRKGHVGDCSAEQRAPRTAMKLLRLLWRGETKDVTRRSLLMAAVSSQRLSSNHAEPGVCAEMLKQHVEK